MDRNHVAVPFVGLSAVALRKESVDRNILSKSAMVNLLTVALRKESVDRNQQYGPVNAFHGDVALRKESVDRNHRSVLFLPDFPCRSPQGERG